MCENAEMRKTLQREMMVGIRSGSCQDVLIVLGAWPQATTDDGYPRVIREDVRKAI